MAGPRVRAARDPNADLIGLSFPMGGGTATVTGSPSWSSAYVEVDTPAGPSVRVASQVRQAKALGGGRP